MCSALRKDHFLQENLDNAAMPEKCKVEVAEYTAKTANDYRSPSSLRSCLPNDSQRGVCLVVMAKHVNKKTELLASISNRSFDRMARFVRKLHAAILIESVT